MAGVMDGETLDVGVAGVERIKNPVALARPVSAPGVAVGAGAELLLYVARTRALRDDGNSHAGKRLSRRDDESGWSPTWPSTPCPMSISPMAQA
jgi:isoaspartyl peptidase/L-asparaginase-like protein (Ntn-hydrolase superfamily)